jgi:Protein of unknown function (DUF2934)
MKIRASRRKSVDDGRAAAAPGTSAAIASDAPGPDQRRSMVATAAYYLSERRGFEPGHELQDWLAAEAEVEAVSRSICLPCAESFWNEP